MARTTGRSSYTYTGSNEPNLGSIEQDPKTEKQTKGKPQKNIRLSDYDYRAHFERFKTALKVAATLYFPD